MPDLAHQAVLRLLMSSADVGMVITRAMATSSREPELAEMLPLIVLASLDLDGPRRPTGLQELTGLSSGGVTKLLDRMEARNVVGRTYGSVPDDHRAVVVAITPYGRRVLRSMTTAAAAVTTDIEAAVTRIFGVIDTV